jgi:hypothetical protein
MWSFRGALPDFPLKSGHLLECRAMCSSIRSGRPRCSRVLSMAFHDRGVCLFQERHELILPGIRKSHATLCTSRLFGFLFFILPLILFISFPVGPPACMLVYLFPCSITGLCRLQNLYLTWVSQLYLSTEHRCNHIAISLTMRHLCPQGMHASPTVTLSTSNKSTQQMPLPRNHSSG